MRLLNKLWNYLVQLIYRRDLESRSRFQLNSDEVNLLSIDDAKSKVLELIADGRLFAHPADFRPAESLALARLHDVVEFFREYGALSQRYGNLHVRVKGPVVEERGHSYISIAEYEDDEPFFIDLADGTIIEVESYVTPFNIEGRYKSLFHLILAYRDHA